MMLTWGVSRPTPASSSESAALLDRLEIWDTPVTYRDPLGFAFEPPIELASRGHN